MDLNYGAFFLLASLRFEEVDEDWLVHVGRSCTWIVGTPPLFDLEKIKNIGTMARGFTIIGNDHEFTSAQTPGFAGLAQEQGCGGFTFFDRSNPRQYSYLKPLWGWGVPLCLADPFSPKPVDFFKLADGKAQMQMINKGYEGEGKPPESGTYAKNAIVWNTMVKSGEPMGWVCEEAGTMGKLVNVEGTIEINKNDLKLSFKTSDSTINDLYYGARVILDDGQRPLCKARVLYRINDHTVCIGTSAPRNFTNVPVIAGDSVRLASRHLRKTPQ
ncbi:MAG: hypothetical protein ABIH23_18100 [bacterium]